MLPAAWLAIDKHASGAGRAGGGRAGGPGRACTGLTLGGARVECVGDGDGGEVMVEPVLRADQEREAAVDAVLHLQTSSSTGHVLPTERGQARKYQLGHLGVFMN